MPKSERILVRGRLYGDPYVYDLVLEEGRLARVGRKRLGTPDIGSEEAVLSPLLFDMQVNGFRGVDLQSPDLRAEDVAEITADLRTYGVSRWVPTLVTAPADVMEHNCRVIAASMKDDRVRRAVPGIHLEGPHISPEDGPRGAHPKAYVCPPDLRAFDRLWKAAEGRILYTTLSPEWEGSLGYIRALVRRGVVVSLGHHSASAERIAQAIQAGARMCTHLGNGAASMMHRHSNPLWPQMADDRLAASLIADGHHLPAPMLKSMFRSKGPERCVLVSDCVHLAGLRPGRYALFDAEVELKGSGKVCLLGTDLLAGSGTPLIYGVFNAAKFGGITLRQAIACATEIPAHLLGLPAPRRHFQVGRRVAFQIVHRDRKGGVKTQVLES